jgi:hypothetical protein
VVVGYWVCIMVICGDEWVIDSNWVIDIFYCVVVLFFLY